MPSLTFTLPEALARLQAFIEANGSLVLVHLTVPGVRRFCELVEQQLQAGARLEADLAAERLARARAELSARTARSLLERLLYAVQGQNPLLVRLARLEAEQYIQETPAND